MAWQLPNWFETIVLYRACWRLGVVAAPIHHQVGGDEAARMIAQLDPALVFAASGLPVAELGPAIAVRHADDPSFDQMLAAPAVPRSVARGADVALVLFTSGSTGQPKGVLHTHRALSYKMRQMVAVHGLGAGDVSLMPLPMAHVSGLLNGLLVPSAGAMTTVLMERWDARRRSGAHRRDTASASWWALHRCSRA